MGWCHEFGPQIREGCGHPMVAGEASCACPHCGVVCTGRFGGCVEVWKRGPIEVALPTRAAPTTLVAEDDPWARFVLESADEAALDADMPAETAAAVAEAYLVEVYDDDQAAWRPSEDGYRPLLSSFDVSSVSEEGIDAWLGAQTASWTPPAEPAAPVWSPSEAPPVSWEPSAAADWPSVWPAAEADSGNGQAVADEVLWEPAPFPSSDAYLPDDDEQPTSWYVVEDEPDADDQLATPEPPAPLSPPPEPVIDRGPRLRDDLPPLPPVPEGDEPEVISELPPLEGLVTLSSKLEALQLDLKLLSVRLAEAPGGDGAAVESVT